MPKTNPHFIRKTAKGGRPPQHRLRAPPEAALLVCGAGPQNPQLTHTAPAAGQENRGGHSLTAGNGRRARKPRASGGASWGAADRLPHATHAAPAEPPPTLPQPPRGQAPPLSPCPSYQTPQHRQQPLRADGQPPRWGAGLRSGRSGRPGRPPARSDRIYRRWNPLRAPLAEPGRSSQGITGRACAAYPPALPGMRAPRSRCCRSRPCARANQGAAGAALPNPHTPRDLTEPPRRTCGRERTGSPANRRRPSVPRPPIAAQSAAACLPARGARANRPAAPSQAAPRLRSGDAVRVRALPQLLPLALPGMHCGAHQPEQPLQSLWRVLSKASPGPAECSTVPPPGAFWLGPSCINSLCVSNLWAFKTFPVALIREMRRRGPREKRFLEGSRTGCSEGRCRG